MDRHPFIPFIISSLFIIVVLTIILSPYIFSYSIGDFGTWSKVVDDKCNSDNTRIQYQTCTPNPITKRGCIDINGKQTYATRTTLVPCVHQKVLSTWETISGVCNPNTLTQHNIKTCISTGNSTGINNCINTELSTTGIPGIPVLTEYPVGSTIEWDQSCFPLVNINQPGLWTSQGSPTPSFNNQFSMIDNCLTDLPNSSNYTILQEGYSISEMVCLPSISTCGELSSTTHVNGQICNPNTLSPLSVADRTLNPNVNPILCNQIPNVISPCRYRPGMIDFGFGNIINHLSNSQFMIFSPNGVISSVQTPALSNNPQVVRFHDWGNNTLDPLANTPLINLEQSDLNRSACTDQQMNFDTGLMVQIGIRNILSSTLIECILFANIPNIYNGWLSTISNNLVWTQSSSNYISPGEFSQQAQRFYIHILSNIDTTPVSGYPITQIGSIQVKITDINNNSVFVNSVSLDSVSLLLFTLDTELCTRSRRTLTNCNLFFDRSLNLDVSCTAPILVP